MPRRKRLSVAWCMMKAAFLFQPRSIMNFAVSRNCCPPGSHSSKYSVAIASACGGVFGLGVCSSVSSD